MNITKVAICRHLMAAMNAAVRSGDITLADQWLGLLERFTAVSDDLPSDAAEMPSVTIPQMLAADDSPDVGATD